MSITKTNRLMLFGKKISVICENYMKHGYVGKVLSFLILEQVAHASTVTACFIWLKRVPWYADRPACTEVFVWVAACVGPTSIRSRNLDTAIHSNRNRRFSRFALAW